ncbi:MAG: D-aminoacyl-tRNA deacylase [Proteobacteria bacterium]|nr:D-aminoacyl-tRNA deacylase [Pseudomonadota bacterium]
MRAVLQRVLKAHVVVEQSEIGTIGAGWLVLLGVGTGDSLRDVSYLADKILNLRAFEDTNGKMNHSVLDNGGDILVVSQFTLYADYRKGRRPSFIGAAPPQLAEPLYDKFVERLRQSGLKVATGRFQANMMVTLVNDGPVTIIIDSPHDAV